MTGLAPDLAERQRQFNRAMAKYCGSKRYQLFGMGVALANVSLQCWLLWQILPLEIGVGGQIGAVLCAWLLADFVNGLVHMYMDSNDRYESIDGPLIANFHLHHKTPRYQVKPLVVVYFVESGSKVWLVPVLLLIALASRYATLYPLFFHVLVYFGVASSLAEVSHYLCHTSTSGVVQLLARCRILLPKRHHAGHHLNDNRQYAFLNGVSDPLLNMLAARLCRGYKAHTDLHYAQYQMDGDSR